MLCVDIVEAVTGGGDTTIAKCNMLQRILSIGSSAECPSALRVRVLDATRALAISSSKHHQTIIEAQSVDGHNLLALVTQCVLNNGEHNEAWALESLMAQLLCGNNETALLLAATLSPAPCLDDSSSEGPEGVGRVLVKTLLTFSAAVPERPRGAMAVWCAAAILGHLLHDSPQCKVRCISVSLTDHASTASPDTFLMMLLKQITASDLQQVIDSSSNPII